MSNEKQNIDSNEETENFVNEDQLTDENQNEKVTEESKPEKKSKKKLSKTEQIQELQYQLAELNDKYLRLFSEFDNYRKRMNKQMGEVIKTASKQVIEDLLPVLDDFDRSIQALKEHNSSTEALEGVELIYNKFFNILKSKGLEPMDSKGKDFDTDYHDAITQTPAPKEELKGKVVDVVEKGYLLNGTIIRHAKVVVGL